MRARCFLVTLLAVSLSGRALGADDAPPSLLLIDGNALLEARERAADGDKAFTEAVRALRRDADDALRDGPFSVTANDATPPSGDKRDYMSVGPYWWPNPNTSDGLPYVRRDGEVNPQRDDFDSKPMSRMVGAVEPLALAWFMTGHEPYAEHAAKLLRAWFLDDATGMNPHLRFGQAIPGRTLGRGIGIIDTQRLLPIIDAAVMLRSSKAWTDDDHAALRAWFGAYARWLRESKHGRDAARARNNIGTWYDVQAVAFALFADQKEPARAILERAKERRIASQIKPDGSMPHELARTRSFDYTAFNLKALTLLATLGERAGVEVWTYQTDDGRGLRAALDWFAPYAAGEKDWPHRQITKLRRGRALEVYGRAAGRFDSRAYRRVVTQLTKDDDVEPSLRLTLPVR